MLVSLALPLTLHDDGKRDEETPHGGLGVQPEGLPEGHLDLGLGALLSSEEPVGELLDGVRALALHNGDSIRILGLSRRLQVLVVLVRHGVVGY